MKIKYLFILLFTTLIYSCDDATTGIGNSTIAGGDSIPAGAAIYEANTRSILADSVYARTSTAYLGKYTDPTFGEFTADFIAQFNCGDNFEFPKTLQKITSVQLRLYYGSHFGDSLNAMRLQVDSLDTIIPEGELSTFYTSVDPKQYYNTNAQPLARKAFSAKGISAEDSTYTYSDGYGSSSYTSYWQTIKLPTNLGQEMYDKYVKHPEYYKDSEQFIKHVLKGFYVSCTHGDGTILYIDDMQLILNFDYLVESSSGRVDSVATGGTVFAATKEVIQANRFQNSERLKELVEEKNHTYIKSPAGIFTEVTLPIQEIAERHQRDTLNAVSITFTRYNEKEELTHKMDAPKYLLMVRKCDMYKFFEENKLHDGKTSFLTQFVSSGASANTYTFANIAPLISYCSKNKNEADWDKVVLIPVKTETDSSGNIIGIKNSLDMASSCLVGGENNPLEIQVLYTTF